MMQRQPTALEIQLMRRYNRDATRRGVSFGLCVEEFSRIITSHCEYCGQPPTNEFGSSFKLKYSGIDRVDNSVGYITGNCVPCCKTCNYAKASMKVHEFEDWVTRVYVHLNKSFRKEKR